MTGLKAVIGKKYHSEEIQNEITKVAYNMTESLGNVTIPVRPPPLPYAPGRLRVAAGRCLPDALQAAQAHAPLPVSPGRFPSRARRT